MLSGYAWLHASLSVLVLHLAVTFVCGTQEYGFLSVLRVLYLNISDPNGEEKYKRIRTSSDAITFLVHVKKG